VQLQRISLRLSARGARLQPRSGRRWQLQRGSGGGLYKILFYFEAHVHESIIFYCSLPTRIAHTIALRLHDYCAMYDAPPTPPLYVIHHTMLVMAISCKGQLRWRWAPLNQSSPVHIYSQESHGEINFWPPFGRLPTPPP